MPQQKREPITDADGTIWYPTSMASEILSCSPSCLVNRKRFGQYEEGDIMVLPIGGTREALYFSHAYLERIKEEFTRPRRGRPTGKMDLDEERIQARDERRAKKKAENRAKREEEKKKRQEERDKERKELRIQWALEIRRALREAEGHRGKAAQILGISRTTFNARAQEVGLGIPSKHEAKKS